MIKERPIPCNSDMVRAILSGQKTKTRRIMKLPDDARNVSYWNTPTGRPQDGYASPGVNYWTDSWNHIDPCPYGFPGDHLWVKETWAANHAFDGVRPRDIQTAASILKKDIKIHYAASEELGGLIKRPSIFMPRWASRILLEITDVCVERLQDITEEDAIAEGVEQVDYIDCGPVYRDYFQGDYAWDALQSYESLWDSLYGFKGQKAWQANPWVWVVSFKRIQ